MSMPDHASVRRAVLEKVKAESNNGRQGVHVNYVVDQLIEQLLPMKTAENKCALQMSILLYWNEMLRGGQIVMGSPEGSPAWGAGLCFITDEGKKTIEHADRDPMNPVGYLAYLDRECSIDRVARGYICEALDTYRSCCYKATAVMAGAAVESLVLDLRDVIVRRLEATRQKVPKGLRAWQVKTILEAIATLVLPDLATDIRKGAAEATRKLCEDAEARLLPIAAEFRRLRNDAGHPASLDPVLPADVHCNLLLFPATAKLLNRLANWATGYYV